MLNSTSNIIKKLKESRMLNERTDYKSKSLDDLVTLAQEGDQLAFNTLVDTHQDFFRKMTNKYFLNTADKDDMMQVVTMAFWDAVKGWNHQGDFDAYAGMLIKQRLTDEIRKENTEKSTFNQDADSLDRGVTDSESGEGKTLGDVVPSGSLSPEDQFISDEGVRVITDFIQNGLSDVERSALKLYIKGYKISEISDKLDIKYKSVENAVRRSKEKIAAYLKDMNEATESNGSIFTDKEISILNSIFDTLGESLVESGSEDLKESEDVTEDQIRAKLDEIDDQIDDLEYALDNVTKMRYYEQIMNDVYDLKDEFPDDDLIEDPELLKYYEEVKSRYDNLEDRPTENLEPIDPYAYNGVSPSDFH